MSDVPDAAEAAALALVRSLAEVMGASIRPEHLAEAVRAWRLMQPHLARVQGAELGPTEEPAALFRP